MTATVLLLTLLAAEPHRLDARRTASAESCPEAKQIQRLVAERLGSNPFISDAPRAVFLSWSGEAGAFSVEISVTDARGVILGTRTLTSKAADCGELAASTALALALIIDPTVLARPRPQPAVEPPPLPPARGVEPEPEPAPAALPAPVPVTENPAPAKVAPPPVSSWGSIWLGGAAAFSLGEVPAPTVQLELEASWVRLPVQVGLRGSFVTPAGKAFGAGAVNALVAAGGPFLCLGIARVGGCASLQLGATYAWPTGFGPSNVSSGTAASVTAGLGPYVDFAPTRALRLRLFLNGQVQPSAAVLVVRSVEAWRTPLFSFTAGLGVRYAVSSDDAGP